MILIANLFISNTRINFAIVMKLLKTLILKKKLMAIFAVVQNSKTLSFVEIILFSLFGILIYSYSRKTDKEDKYIRVERQKKCIFKISD